MTKEEKQLLLKDLCARFFYGVIVRVHDIEHGDFDSYVDSISNTCIETHPVEELTMDFNPYVFYKFQEIRPYLRPLSSMTEEEIDEYHKRCEFNDCDYTGEPMYFDTIDSFDYLYSIHVDCRGLIPMGFALEAPEEMYKTE